VASGKVVRFIFMRRVLKIKQMRAKPRTGACRQKEWTNAHRGVAMVLYDCYVEDRVSVGLIASLNTALLTTAPTVRVRFSSEEAYRNTGIHYSDPRLDRRLTTLADVRRSPMLPPRTLSTPRAVPSSSPQTDWISPAVEGSDNCGACR